MHCSLWTFRGDPDDLAARYEAMIAEVPAEAMRFAACLRTPDGLVMVDTCPSKEVFDAFFSSDGLRGLLERHGLRPDEVVDHPVIAAFVDGRRIVGGDS